MRHVVVLELPRNRDDNLLRFTYYLICDLHPNVDVYAYVYIYLSVIHASNPRSGRLYPGVLLHGLGKVSVPNGTLLPERRLFRPPLRHDHSLLHE